MTIDDVRESIERLAKRMDERFASLEQRMDQRFTLVDQRFNNMDARFDRVYGLLIALLIAAIGGMGGIIAAILHR